MHIIHILNHLEWCNGHVHVAVDLACTQAGLGHKVCVISGGGTFEPLLTSHQVQHIKIDQTRRPLNLIRALVKLWQAVASFQPDIIHAHMATSTVLACALRPFMRFKLINTVHNEFDKSSSVMRFGDRTVGVSQAVVESMAKRGVPQAKLRMVLNGTLGSPRIDHTSAPASSVIHPAVIFVGGIHPRKGVGDLIEAFKQAGTRFPSARLYLVGDGPMMETYYRLAAETGIKERIIFPGPQMDPRPYLLAADIFALASHADPGPLVLAEAREAGCAIIATDVGGNAEMLDHGKAGVLVPAKRPDLLAEAIERVLGDPALQADLKSRAKANLDYFTVDRVTRDYLRVYEELLPPLLSPQSKTPESKRCLCSPL